MGTKDLAFVEDTLPGEVTYQCLDCFIEEKGIEAVRETVEQVLAGLPPENVLTRPNAVKDAKAAIGKAKYN